MANHRLIRINAKRRSLAVLSDFMGQPCRWATVKGISTGQLKQLVSFPDHFFSVFVITEESQASGSP